MDLTLCTKRLALVAMTDQDIEFLTDLLTLPIVNRFEQKPQPSREEAEENCRSLLEKAKKIPEAGALRWIVRTSEGDRIGQVQITCNWEDTREWEIGYTFLPQHWSQGYATEAVERLIRFAFEDLKVHKIVALINAENKRSVALAKRLKMVQEGFLREARLIAGVYYDEIVFALLKTDLD